MIAFSYFKGTKSFTYHNPLTKRSVVLNCNYFGFSQPNIFTGIKSTTSPDGKPTIEKPVLDEFIHLSRFCSLFTLISIVSMLTSVVLFVRFLSTNLLYSVLSLVVGLLINFMILIVANYLENFFLSSVPNENGWLRAYIDDFGTISVVDEKSGKTIPFSTMENGKKRITMITQEEFDKTYNAFFGKGGVFDKKK